MDQCSSTLKVLYYLNLAPKDQALGYIVKDRDVFNDYLQVANETRGTMDPSQLTKRILKKLRKSAAL